MWFEARTQRRQRVLRELACRTRLRLITQSFALLSTPALVACGSEDGASTAFVNTAGIGASASGTMGSVVAGSLASSAGGAGSVATPSRAGVAGGASGARAMAAPSSRAGGPAPANAAGAAAPAAMSGGAGMGATTHDGCGPNEPPDPRDAQLPNVPDQWKSPVNGAIDLVVPKLVLEWMGERSWEVSHDAWHNIRRCRGGVPVPGGRGAMSLCSMTELVPQHQECADAEDGYQFLVVHRHMLQALQRAFPQHAALFEGFPRFPFEAKDVPVEWQDRWGSGWTAQIKQTAMTLEDIENRLSMFPTEGDLGRFIQCGGMANGASSIHGALHFKWVVNDSPYSLGKQTVNLDNHMFWKLHGWIDKIWERYRVAKGLAPDEPKLQQALVDQCREMHTLGHVVRPGATTPGTTMPLPAERGEFHEKVRPILEKTCSSCHSESSPEAALSLGGKISSADIVKGLVNVRAMHGGQFMRVVPGDASKSWLYLKVSGMAMGAGCTGAMCNAQVMPPTGQVTLSEADLNAIRLWIANGAQMPTQ